MIAVENLYEAGFLRPDAKSKHRKTASEQGMRRVHDLDEVRISEIGRIDGGINMVALGGRAYQGACQFSS